MSLTASPKLESQQTGKSCNKLFPSATITMLWKEIMSCRAITLSKLHPEANGGEGMEGFNLALVGFLGSILRNTQRESQHLWSRRSSR